MTNTTQTPFAKAVATPEFGQVLILNKLNDYGEPCLELSFMSKTSIGYHLFTHTQSFNKNEGKLGNNPDLEAMGKEVDDYFNALTVEEVVGTLKKVGYMPVIDKIDQPHFKLFETKKYGLVLLHITDDLNERVSLRVSFMPKLFGVCSTCLSGMPFEEIEHILSTVNDTDEAGVVRVIDKIYEQFPELSGTPKQDSPSHVV